MYSTGSAKRERELGCRWYSGCCSRIHTTRRRVRTIAEVDWTRGSTDRFDPGAERMREYVLGSLETELRLQKLETFKVVE